jgi:hypothetical protein
MMNCTRQGTRYGRRLDHLIGTHLPIGWNRFRPYATSTVAIYYVRFTSIRDIASTSQLRKQRSSSDVANVSNRHLASVSTRTQKSASSSPSCCLQPAPSRFQSTCNFESHSFRLYRGATVTGADIDIAARPPLRRGYRESNRSAWCCSGLTPHSRLSSRRHP